MCEVCRFLQSLPDINDQPVDVISITIAAGTVKRLASVLREVAEMVELEYYRLDGKSVIGIMRDATVTVEYEHLKAEDYQRRSEINEHTNEKTKNKTKIPFANSTARNN